MQRCWIQEDTHTCTQPKAAIYSLEEDAHSNLSIHDHRTRLHLPDVDHVRFGVPETKRWARIPLLGTPRLRNASRRVTPRITNVCHPRLHMLRAARRWFSPAFMSECRLYIATWVSAALRTNVHRALGSMRNTVRRRTFHANVEVLRSFTFAASSAQACDGGAHRGENVTPWMCAGLVLRVDHSL